MLIHHCVKSFQDLEEEIPDCEPENSLSHSYKLDRNALKESWQTLEKRGESMLGATVKHLCPVAIFLILPFPLILALINCSEDSRIAYVVIKFEWI